jgi:hypothetical protein
MKAEEFVKSGTLELYCLGLLNDEERKEVDNLILAYPSLKIELSAVENSVKNYCELYNPDLSLNLEEIEQQLNNEFENEEPIKVVENYQKEGSKTSVKPSSQKLKNNKLVSLSIIFFLSLLILLVISGNFYRNSNNLTIENQELKYKLSQFKENPIDEKLDNPEIHRTTVKEFEEILSSTEYSYIKLQNQDIALHIHFVKKSKSLFFNYLNQNNKNLVYTLWYANEEKDPVKIIELDEDSKELVIHKLAQNPSYFSITATNTIKPFALSDVVCSEKIN